MLKELDELCRNKRLSPQDVKAFIIRKIVCDDTIIPKNAASFSRLRYLAAEFGKRARRDFPKEMGQMLKLHIIEMHTNK